MHFTFFNAILLIAITAVVLLNATFLTAVVVAITKYTKKIIRTNRLTNS